MFAETALACMLLIGSGLATKSLWKLHKIDPGFNPHNVTAVRVTVPRSTAPDRIPDFYRQVLDRVRVLPGVESATLGRDLPMSGHRSLHADHSRRRNSEACPGRDVITRLRAIAPTYFHTLQIPCLCAEESSRTMTRRLRRTW